MPHPALDRRAFLAAAGGGVTLPLLPGCAGAPAPVVVPPSEQVTLGVIGMGIRARNMLNRYFLRDPQWRVLAVCDVDQQRREHFKGVVDKKYDNQDCAAILDYRDLLERKDIDAVVIATPDHWHATQCIHAAQAGKDIYCEKPLTHTLLEGQRIIAAVRKHERVFQTGSQQRTEFGQRFVRAVEYVRNGRIGELLECYVGVGDPPRACDLEEEKIEPGLDWDRWLGPAATRPYNSVLSPRGIIKHYPKWRHFHEYAGGQLADMGAHHFDIVQWALDADRGGPVEAIPPRDPKAKRGVSLRYADGLKVTHGGASGATFIGSKGIIQVDRGRLTGFPGNLFKKPLGEDEFRLPRHPDHATDWLQCIKERKTPIADVEIGARTAAVCQLANLAYRHRQVVKWDPEAWRFRDPRQADWLDYERRPGYELPEA